LLSKEGINLSDFWATGIMLYKAVTHKFPFNSKYESVLHEKILMGNYHIEFHQWENHKESCDLLNKILKPEHLRILTSEILNHKWFRKYDSKKSLTSLQNIIKSIFDYRNSPMSMQKLFIIYLSKHVTEKEFGAIKTNFVHIDYNFNGKIGIQEIEKIIRENKNESLEQAKILLKKMQSEGEISYQGIFYE